MGLKIRRLKNGFAFYGEYKFGSGSGRQNCIYERVEAASLREAKKKYAARRVELLAQLRDGSGAPAGKPIIVHESGASRIDSELASLLRILVMRGAVADPSLGELLRSALKQIDRAESSAAAMEICNRIRGELLTRIAPSTARKEQREESDFEHGAPANEHVAVEPELNRAADESADRNS